MKKIRSRALVLFPTPDTSVNVLAAPDIFPGRISGSVNVLFQSGVRALGLLFLLLAASSLSFSQTTYTMNSSGDWSASGNWSLTTGPATGSPPNSTTASAVLASGVSATVNGNYTVLNLTINMNGGLTINAGQTLTVEGNLTISNNINPININGGTLIVKGNIVINGNVNLNVGSIAPNSGKLQVNGNIVSNSSSYNVNISTNANSPTTTSSGTIAVGGNVVVPGNGSNANGPAGSMSIGGSCTPAGSSGDQTLCYKLNNNGMLPVVLTAFNASVTGSGVELTWTTSSEINFDYFNLQRSLDGKDFQTIARVQGHGTTHEKHNYSYIDHFPLAGISYYRLQSVDFDGHIETFDAVHVSYDEQKSLRVFPNPANGSVTLRLNFAPSEAVDVQIMSLNGMEISRFEMSDMAPSYITLSPGTYLVKVASAEINRVFRIVSR